MFGGAWLHPSLIARAALLGNEMTDFLIALAFLFVYEVLSWPLRLALIPMPMAGDLRRMISRVAGPVSIALAVWVGAHAGVPLSFAAACIWFLLFLAGGYVVCRAQGRAPRLIEVVVPISFGLRWKRETIGTFIGSAVREDRHP